MSHSWWRNTQRPHPGKRSRRKLSFQPQLEALEARQVPATLMVTSTADSGTGSLRQAILDADNTTANPGQNTIKFNIATSGVQTITPITPLPFLTNPAGVIIDGTSEGGFAGTPLIVLDGSQTGGGNGLAITGGNSTVKGLALEHFTVFVAALELASNNNTVQGDFIGTDAAGTGFAGNFYGIFVSHGATGNVIGGTTAAARNVISGNRVFGVLFQGSGVSGNLLEGNYIGTDATGTVPLANGFHGVGLTGAANNTIGGSGPGAANVISGNAVDGVLLFGAGTSGNLLEGNFIGTNTAGSAALPNSLDGVVVDAGATGNTIGGTASTAGNVISGNRRNGVLFNGSGTTGNAVFRDVIGLNALTTAALPNGVNGVAVLAGASGNTIGSTVGGLTTPAAAIIAGNAHFGILVAAGNTVIQNNLIGTNLSSAAGLGNGVDGIAVIQGANNTIGGTATAAGNLISGNGRFGIFLDGTGASGNVVQGNNVGLSLGGTLALANTFDAVALFGGAAGNTIGGTVAAAANVLSGNGRFGVYLSDAGTSGNVVQGNFIGVNRSGSLLANGSDGVSVLSGASGNTIGGTVAAAANVISGNGRAGVVLGVQGTSNNRVQGNLIGTDTAGTAADPNVVSGVAIVTGASTNTIGGTAAGVANVISGNTGSGIEMEESTTTGNVVQGNLIGTGISGTTALGNGTDGILLHFGVSTNTIGGTVAAAANVIAASKAAGVLFDASSGNVVQGNFIGIDKTQTLPGLGNLVRGVSIVNGSTNNLIGGPVPGAGNIITGNNLGILINNVGTTGNVVQGNIVGADTTGTPLVKPTNGGGISIGGGASNNTVGGVQSVPFSLGGTITGAGNIIANNPGNGMTVGSSSSDTGTGNEIEGNVIGNNGSDATSFLGIDLGNFGFPNPNGSSNTGPNHLQNFPTINSVTPISGGVTINYSLTNTTSGATYHVEFFANNNADNFGYYEGQIFLGSDTISGSGSKSVTLNGVTVTAAQHITATATDPNGNSSEFSLGFLVGGA